MENKKQSEIVAVQDLLELLDLKGVVFTMDALHCQKADATPRRRQAQGNAHQAKQFPRSSPVAMII